MTTQHHRGLRLLRASAAYLGITVDQLEAKLASGQTPAQIANATAGKSATGLLDDLVSLDRLQTKIERLVNTTWTRHR
jgi:hypothetical protein